jgi:hypothetical protein
VNPVAADESHKLWLNRVAEAARRAAADIDPDREPQLQQLHADLVTLSDRLVAEAEQLD